MHIRLVAAEDKEVALNIYSDCRHAMQRSGIYQWTDTYPSAELIEADIAQGHLYGLYINESCIGLITLNAVQETEYEAVNWLGSNPLIIHRLAVLPSFHNKGLGKVLMKFAEKHAAKYKHNSLRLDSFSGNIAALTFYEKLGFRKTGEVYFPGRILPFFCFEKILTG